MSLPVQAADTFITRGTCYYMSSSGMVSIHACVPPAIRPYIFQNKIHIFSPIIKSNMVKYSTEPKDVTKGEFFFVQVFLFRFFNGRGF